MTASQSPSSSSSSSSVGRAGRRPTVVLTMAGLSRRFAEAGFSEPKYRIAVGGRTLFAWSLVSLTGMLAAGADLVCVARADDAGVSEFAAEQCALLGVAAPRMVLLDRPTRGQAETALWAAETLDPQAPLAIYNIDTHVSPEALGAGPDPASGLAGWIPCFAAPGEHWSFVSADPNGRVYAVAEKRRISPDATVGLYWFGCAGDFVAAARTAQVAAQTLPELYVAPLYADLLAAGRPVRATRLPAAAVVPLGTPQEVEVFARRLGVPAPRHSGSQDSGAAPVERRQYGLASPAGVA